ncbi:hypothetical protein GDO81_019842 [Engystomops pustulosus]|uniref:NIDO domain-containing protein n=1 Tax=Engystomops pustulosus TaxID=76066 RepID=A0AAV6ZJI6_ENGPU|nr:hypothetical protein GDO81_019842 [Engystomops pustulosus]
MCCRHAITCTQDSLVNFSELQWTSVQQRHLVDIGHTTLVNRRKTRISIGEPTAGLRQDRAGYNNADGTSYYTIPGSMTPDMINISSTSNVNFTGRWFFEVDKSLNISQNTSAVTTAQVTSPSSTAALTTTSLSSNLTGPALHQDLLYPYGSGLDALCPVSDDQRPPLVYLLINLHLFGRTYSTLYVDDNGLLSFRSPISTFTPHRLPMSINNPFLAIFWADVYTPNAGNISYRQSTWDPELLARATSDIRNYTQDQNFQAQWVFVATWNHVAYFGSTSNKVNTFQAVLISDGNSTYTLFNYADIQWTTGTASGGSSSTGLGGTPALAGLNNADGTSYYTIPGSMTPAMINISSTSNVNFTGRWFFKVDQPLNSLQETTTQYLTTTTTPDASPITPQPLPINSDEAIRSPTVQFCLLMALLWGTYKVFYSFDYF